MRFLDELITLPSSRESGVPVPPADGTRAEKSRGAEIERPPGATARHMRARHAEMAPAAFCKLVAIWIGAVAIALVAVLTVRWFG